eukprot:gb/GECG01011536.1/.p1 GENE.gb/GECG01011536.1/~~gb/GECG01011536.1/.p1  ORF type:complete len:206 (+),score=14.10 gb/GECG01011536.1/:1-618(+)
MERPPIVLDNGGYKLRAGFAGLREPACDMVNATAHVEKQINTLIGDDIETHVNDKSQLRYTRPIQRGYITDFDTQKTLWERVFSEEVLDIHPQEHALLCTQPYFNASTITKYLCEMVFEQFGFQSFAMANSEPLMFLEHLGTSASEYIEEIKKSTRTKRSWGLSPGHRWAWYSIRSSRRERDSKNNSSGGCNTATTSLPLWSGRE